MADLIPYVVKLTVWVKATDEDEAQLILERHLAGFFDPEVIEVVSEKTA
jgi:hypothetical protein